MSEWNKEERMLTTYVAPKLKAKLVQIAAKEGRTVSGLCRVLLERGVKNHGRRVDRHA